MPGWVLNVLLMYRVAVTLGEISEVVIDCSMYPASDALSHEPLSLPFQPDIVFGESSSDLRRTRAQDGLCMDFGFEPLNLLALRVLEHIRSFPLNSLYACNLPLLSRCQQRKKPQNPRLEAGATLRVFRYPVNPRNTRPPPLALSTSEQ